MKTKLLFILSLFGATCVYPQAVRNAAERSSDRRQISYTKETLQRDNKELSDFKTAVKAFYSSENQTQEKNRKNIIISLMEKEIRQAENKIAMSEREVRQSKSEVRSDRREIRRNRADYGRGRNPRDDRRDMARDRADKRDDRRDVRDDYVDSHRLKERKSKQSELLAGFKACNDPCTNILNQFIQTMESDIKQSKSELIEDKGELREDRLESRDDRRERREPY